MKNNFFIITNSVISKANLAQIVKFAVHIVMMKNKLVRFCEGFLRINLFVKKECAGGT